jgi:hypothetical protein
MTTLSPFLSIDSSCDQALQATKTKLSQVGLSAVQTFNLTTARLGVHNCSCPNHGTEACDCQMIVLLVYGNVAEPATLILHGNNGKTWLSFADTLLQPINAGLMTSIREALDGLSAADA